MSINRAGEVWKEIKPFALRDLAVLNDGKSTKGGGTGYYIILYDESAQKLRYYSATSAGLAAALAAASSGDIVFLPACTITNSASSFTPGAEISTGAITVTNESGHEIPGLTIGEWYVVESWNGYFSLGVGWALIDSNIDMSLVSGSGFSGNVGQIADAGDKTTPHDSTISPSFCVHSECFDGGDGKRYGRTYFQATQASVYVRDHDVPGSYADITGTLSWRLRSATVTIESSIPAGVEVAGLGENCIINGNIENNGMLTNVKVTGVITGTGSYHAFNNSSEWITNKSIVSKVSTGAAPFEVDSTTKNINLNADLVDGEHMQKRNLSASTAPGVGDDANDGYSVGSRWLDTTGDKEYVCLDATVGAAVWLETTGLGDMDKVTTVGNPGSDTKIPTEQAVREAITALPAVGAGGITFGADIFNNANISIPNDQTPSYIFSFNSVRTDSGGFYNATNPERLTIPANGWYVVAGSLCFAKNSNGIREMFFKMNAAQTTLAVQEEVTVPDTFYKRMTISIVRYFVAGDYIVMGCYQNSGGALDVIYSDKQSPEFSIALLTYEDISALATDALWDAKGDLAVGTGANTAARLPVGINGQILYSDSGQATGIRWGDPPVSGGKYRQLLYSVVSGNPTFLTDNDGNILTVPLDLESP